MRGYSNGVIRVRFNVVSAIVNWKLAIIFSLNAVLVLESGNVAWLDADWIGLRLFGMILCS